MHVAEPNWNRPDWKPICDSCDKRIGFADEFRVWEPVLQDQPWYAFIHRRCDEVNKERWRNNEYVVDFSALMDGTLDREIAKSFLKKRVLMARQ